MPPQPAANTSPDKETNMKSKYLYILIASMFAISGNLALAQESGLKLSGSFGTGGIGTNEDSKDAAKLQEYRDLWNGAFGTFDLRGRSKRFYFDWYGENLGRDDMHFDLKGGMYDQFKYRLRGDWLTHNFSFGPDGARTPYTNPGSTNLTLFSTSPTTLSNTNVGPWTSFGFGNERRDLGATFEFSFKSPWYFLADASQVSQVGINKVDAAALGTSPGNGFMDLPYPVDFTTRNVSGEIGYQKLRGHFSVNWIQSNFNNNNIYLKFQNPFFGFGSDIAPFAPGNHYVRISATGMLRKLPWNSTLSGRVTFDRGTDSQDMITAVLNTSGSSALFPTNPSEPTFDGKVENTTAHFSVTSSPIRHLDVRTYYNFYKRSNKSTEILFNVSTSGLVCLEQSTTSATNLNVPCEGERYQYTKHNPGIEAGYRLTAGNRLTSGFDYLDTQRNRFDTEATKENKLFVQWSNSSLASLTARVKYQYMQRRSDFITNNAGFNANDQFYLERFSHSFDVSNLNQHLIKADLDWSPLKFLDFGLEAYYKRDNYRGLKLGRLNDRRKEFYGSIAYGNPEKFRVTLFGDVEFINYDSYHRTVNATPCPTSAPNCFDPDTAPTTTAFNWSSQLRDKNWTVELGFDWPLTSKLTFKGSAILQQTKGGVDFQSQTLSTGAPAALLFPINAYDNTRRQSINPHAVYLIKQVELSAGYAFDKYNYTDDQFNGYRYTIGSGTSTSYLAGVYAFPDYHAHITYGAMRYLF
jgi:hypothetical protein